MPGYLRFAVVLSTLASLLPAQDPGEFFESRVRPVLSKNCFACHTNSKLGGLELDSRDHLLKGGNSGPAIVPGQPESSLLIQAVRRSHERFKMPPQGKLSDEEVANLASWVKMGAVWPQNSTPPVSAEYTIRPEQRAFWSFQPVRRPAVPDVKAPTVIDRFILAKLQSQGLKPVKPADRRALIRRVTFDLIGLPPKPEEVDAFVSDRSPEAFAKVVDRLLASPHYGERWARAWLDLARYADGNLGAYKDTPYPYAYRYRDWVIRAFNQDMPYDLFLKAQLAADMLPDNKELLPALGFHALGGNSDERVDVTTRVFLGLTVGCAQCHDHKYDPIPTKDYYSLQGVFRSSENYALPLAPEAEVKAYNDLTQRIEDQKFEVADFLRKSNVDLAEMLIRKTAKYMVATFAPDAPRDNLDPQILERWTKYLQSEKEHPYLKPWDALVARHGTMEEARKLADEFQTYVIAMFEEKKIKDDRNYVALGGVKGVRDEKTRQYTNLEGLDIERYYLWRDLASEPYKKEFLDFKGGVYYFGDKQIDRLLSAEAKEYYAGLKAELAALNEPKQYSFLHTVRDTKKPADARVAIRGDAQTPGEVAPRRNLSILCNGEPARFTKGSGRLELAESIVSRDNPLTARVIVNRIWKMHFGQGIVRTPSNFGQLGDRPTHPELLDYLASRFVEKGWSMKAIHREILLSSTYQLSTDHNEANAAKDPENRLLWRANLRQRLDAEELRDSLLAVAGKLDLEMYGPPVPLTDKNLRRTLYGYVGRTQPDRMLALFDFPNPNNMSEQRTITVGPMQRLYFLNNDFVIEDAKAVAERLDADTDEAKITQAYRLLFGRPPTKQETTIGLTFLHGPRDGQPRPGGAADSPERKRGDAFPSAWQQYTQALLSSSEFSTVN